MTMGNWTMVIEGTGQHNSNSKNDSDELLREFVMVLKQSGQIVDHVTITAGMRETVR
jgi:cell wall-associated NlpC family hydrolase